jgi:thiamine biosynthesis protein ThiI
VLFLVRFGEIHLKSRYVRKQFQDRLVANIQDHFAARGVECLTSSDRGRVYVETDDEGAGRSILGRVFGVVSSSPVVECPAEIETISRRLVDYSRHLVKEGASFAIRSRRVGSHEFTSHDVAVAAGKAMQEAHPSLRVDLTEPDVELFIEVRNNRAFLFNEVVEGPGGLPLGTQGRVLALVDGERGTVVAWMMMKRGCYTPVAAFDGEEHVEPLRKWDLHLKVQRISKLDELRDIARLNRAKAVAVGWSLEEVERRRGEIPEDVTLFHPAVGLTSEEVASMAARIRRG